MTKRRQGAPFFSDALQLVAPRPPPASWGRSSLSYGFLQPDAGQGTFLLRPLVLWKEERGCMWWSRSGRRPAVKSPQLEASPFKEDQASISHSCLWISPPSQPRRPAGVGGIDHGELPPPPHPNPLSLPFPRLVVSLDKSVANCDGVAARGGGGQR